MGVSQYRLGKRHKENGSPYMGHMTKCYDSTSAQQSYDNGYETASPVTIEKQCMCCLAVVYRGTQYNMPRRVECPDCGVAQDTSYIPNCGATVGNNKTGHRLPAGGGRR